MNYITTTKGTPVKPTERTAKTPSPRTGLGVRPVVPGASLASAGPSAARTQGAVLGGAKDKPEDAAARSVSAAARGVRGATGWMLPTLRALLHVRGTGAPSAPRLVLTPLITLAALLSALAVSAAPASAGTAHEFQSSITETEPLAPFGNPWGLAFDSTGNLYVADATGEAIDIFNPLSVFQPPQLNDASVSPAEPFTGPYVRSVAVDNLPGPNRGTVYVAESNGENVDVFKPEGGGKYKLVQERHFGNYMYVAFDNSASGPISGDVYVIANHTVDVIKPNAAGELEELGVELTAPTGGFSLGGSENDGGLAVGPTGNVYLANPAEKAVDVYSNEDVLEEAATITGSETPGGAGSFEPIAVGVDPSNGEVYVVDAANKAVDEFSSVGKYLGQIKEAKPGAALVNPLGVAVNASGDVYVSDGGAKAVDVFGPDLVVPDVITGEATNLTTAAGQATLNGTVNPDGVALSACQFEYASAEEYKPGTNTPYTKMAGCEPSPGEGAGHIGKGLASVPVSATVTGLKPATVYHYRLIAANTNGQTGGQDRSFVAPGVVFAGESVSNVAATSATLEAQINPNGGATTYRFEYGPTASYGQSAPIPDGNAGSGSAVVTLSAHLQGLMAGTGYHYRVIASGVGVATGPDQTFTTQPTGGEFTLPDGRQWEMVTPPQKQGGVFERNMPSEKALAEGGVGRSGGTTTIQASAGGGAIAVQANQPTEAEPQGYGAPKVAVLATRGASGWSSQVIAPPRAESAAVSEGDVEYRLFSQDLSRAIVQPFGNFDPLLSPEATESTAYLHTDYLNGNVGEHCQISCFQPLVTPANDTAVPFQPFGEKYQNVCFHQICGPYFLAATPDLSHVVVRSPVQLTSTPIVGEARYEWSAGRLQLLSLLPGGEPGSLELGGETGPGDNPRHAISNDGGRVVLQSHSSPEGTTEALYLRDVAKGETVRLDVPQGAGTEASAEARYMTASSDGSRIFFLDAGRLTPDSGAEPRKLGSPEVGKPDLYECDIVAVEGKDKCDLTDLTPETGGESATVKMVLGSSEDGSYVYFVAGGLLAPGAVKDGPCRNKETASPEACNLYVRHQGETRFLAGLSGNDPDLHAEPASLPVRVSSGGRWLAFMSERPLTGYDTRDAVTGRPDQEVYLYDASSNRLVCASCDPTGARPVGLHTGSNDGIAALLPSWNFFAREAGYQPRFLSDGGRLFFDSKDALVPRDVNGVMDVYQYEPEGVPAGEHACTSASMSGSVAFKPAHAFEVEGVKGEEGAGCVGLISSGASSQESTFLDASETGGDVFFLTNAKLSPQDFDTAPDVYDAHECTSVSPCLPPPAAQPLPCDTEASCKAAPSPQPDIFGSPASGTFSGPGNIPPPLGGRGSNPKTAAQIRAEKLAAALKSCRKKHNKHKRATCEKQAHKKYGAAKKAKRATRATNDRRAK